MPKEGGSTAENAAAQEHLQGTLTCICQGLSPRHDLGDQQELLLAPVQQMMVALYLFPQTVQPLLKLQKIKPHWMFTLDDLIRNAVQQAIKLLKPGGIFEGDVILNSALSEEPANQEEEEFKQSTMVRGGAAQPPSNLITANSVAIDLNKSYTEQIKK